MQSGKSAEHVGDSRLKLGHMLLVGLENSNKVLERVRRIHLNVLHRLQNRRAHTSRETAPGRHRPAPHPAVPGLAGTERCCSAATRNQHLAVIKSFCRYTAVEQPDRLDQLTQILAIRQKNTPAPDLGHLTGDEIKVLLAQPGTASNTPSATPCCSPWPTTPPPVPKKSATSTSPTSGPPTRSP